MARKTNKNLDDIVYEKIKEAIILNKFPPNYKLVESDIAEKMNVSRTPVHTAIKLLERDGLIKLTPNKGAVIKNITYKDIKDSFSVRVELEKMSIRKAIDKITAKDIKMMERILTEEEKAYNSNNRQEAYLLGSKFHKNIAKVTGNDFLYKYVCDIVDKTDSFDVFFIISDPGLEKKFLTPEQHQKILKLIKSKDVKKTEEVMESHIRTTEEQLPNLLSHFHSNNINEFLKIK